MKKLYNIYVHKMWWSKEKNEYGNPIFLSLLKNGSNYEGHYFGTADILARAAKAYFYKNAIAITRNLQNFKTKYKTKSILICIYIYV